MKTSALAISFVLLVGSIHAFDIVPLKYAELAAFGSGRGDSQLRVQRLRPGVQ